MGLLVREFLNFIGGSVWWIYGSIWRTIANKPKFTFSEYIYGSKNPDYYDTMGHRMNNIIIAFIRISIIFGIIL